LQTKHYTLKTKHFFHSIISHSIIEILSKEDYLCLTYTIGADLVLTASRMGL